MTSQIPVNSRATDYSTFQELRRCYGSRWGRLRLWFSVWRLEYCESVKVHSASETLEDKLMIFHSFIGYRLTVWSVIKGSFQLTMTISTSPVPQQPMPRIPPIAPHIFQSLFYTRPSRCTWSLLNECIPSRAGSTRLERIPKRGQSFE